MLGRLSQRSNLPPLDPETLMDQTLEIPVFPLGTVLYPAGRLPLRIFETRYVEMTKRCLRDNSVFGVALIQAGFEAGVPAIPFDVGCTSRIVEWEVPNPGLFMLMTQGESVFRIVERRTQPDGLILARVQLAEPPDPMPLPERHEGLRTLLVRLMDEIGDDYFPKPSRLNDAAWVSYRLSELLPVTPERKQKLLEIGDPLTRLDDITELLKSLRDEP